MTDLYIEDPDDYDAQLSAVQRLRAEVGRAAHKLERAVLDARDNAVDETRFLAHAARRRINANLGLSAAIALGVGLGLGLLTAAIVALNNRGVRR
jgi:ElaB/YqjD/DUF883 family membrane-anchored ribosome-binding protein